MDSAHVHQWCRADIVDRCHLSSHRYACECGAVKTTHLERDFHDDTDPLAVAFADPDCQRCRELIEGAEPDCWQNEYSKDEPYVIGPTHPRGRAHD